MSATKQTELLPCPFCGEQLSAPKRKFNPYARCVTRGCKGSQLPILNLDMPDDVERWNTRAQSAPEPVQGEAVAPFVFALMRDGDPAVIDWTKDEDVAKGWASPGFHYIPLYTAAAKPDAELVELLKRCQEKLDPHRDAVLWGDVVDALRAKP